MQENRTQDADEHGRSLRPWPVVARGGEAPVDLSQNTHGLVCYIPPPSCPSNFGASRPVADHHSPWRLSLHAVSPSACVCVYGHDDFLPPPILPGPSIRAGWPGRMAAFRDCSLARAAVVLCCDRLSRRLRLVCVSACLLISARLVKSLSFSLYCFASLSYSPPLCRILPLGGFCCLTTRLSSCSQKLAHQQENFCQRHLVDVGARRDYCPCSRWPVLLSDVHSLIRGPPAACKFRLHPRTIRMTRCDGPAAAALSTRTGLDHRADRT